MIFQTIFPNLKYNVIKLLLTSCIVFIYVFIIFIIIYCSYFMFTGLYTVYVYIPSSFFTIESPLGGSLFLAL